jgi:hypothetical protein
LSRHTPKARYQDNTFRLLVDADIHIDYDANGQPVTAGSRVYGVAILGAL